VATDLIQLAIHQPNDARRATTLVSLAGNLLSLIGRHIVDAASRKAAAFRRRLEEWRDDLQREQDPDRLDALAYKIVTECADVLEHLVSDRADRDAELADLTNVLRDVVESLRGDARKFEAEFQRSTRAMESMVEIQDIRELKRQLVQEVEALRKTAQERGQAEAQQVELLSGKVTTLERSLQEAREEAATDPLTGIANRGTFDSALRDWICRAGKDGKPFALAMVDLDDFKKINDTHGHPVGDRVLIAAAQLLSGCVAEGDLAARYGGEEFALLFGEASAPKAKQRLLAALQGIAPAYEYEVEGEKRFVTFTFSGGVTVFDQSDTCESLVKRADEALYDAKRRGKKRVEIKNRSFLRALVG
jgi:diguanylate cyclase